MTDPAATASDNNTATAADNGTAPPDAAALAKEVEEYKDKLLRSLAEMENLRRRTDREVADARAYGVSGLARDLIGVADNLRRALEAAGESAALTGGPVTSSLRSGCRSARPRTTSASRRGVPYAWTER